MACEWHGEQAPAHSLQLSKLRAALCKVWARDSHIPPHLHVRCGVGAGTEQRPAAAQTGEARQGSCTLQVQQRCRLTAMELCSACVQEMVRASLPPSLLTCRPGMHPCRTVESLRSGADQADKTAGVAGWSAHDSHAAHQEGCCRGTGRTGRFFRVI